MWHWEAVESNCASTKLAQQIGGEMEKAFWFVVAMIVVTFVAIGYMAHDKSEVYICSEVTQNSPADVKRICERAYKWRGQ